MHSLWAWCPTSSTRRPPARPPTSARCARSSSAWRRSTARPAPAGEREAAEWIAERFRAARARRGGPRGGAQLGHLPAADHRARRARRARRRCSPPPGAGARPRLCAWSPSRGSSTRPRTGPACCGGRCAGGGAPSTWSRARATRARRRTLVVHAHHDAAQTGRFYDQSLMIAAAPPPPAADGEAETAAAAVVARACWRRWRRWPTNAARAARRRRSSARCSARSASPPRPTSGAARRCPAPTTTSRAWPRCSRSPRWCASSPLAGPARAARLLRGRGDPPGRHPRVRRLPPATSSRPSADVVPEPRRGRLAEPDDARGARGRSGWRSTPTPAFAT